MGSQYYYFVSSLPALDFFQKESVPIQDFLAACQEQLSCADRALMSWARVDLEPEHAPGGFLRQWAIFNRHLKNEIARSRAKRFSKKETEALKESFFIDLFCADVVARAAKAAHPLDAERILDEARWKKLEELSLGYYFDLEAIMIYALKLQILNRQKILASTEGQKRFSAYKDEEIFAKMEL